MELEETTQGECVVVKKYLELIIYSINFKISEGN